MAMKKIKPQYGKIVPPMVTAQADDGIETVKSEETGIKSQGEEMSESVKASTELPEIADTATIAKSDKIVSRITAEPNPFLQTKEIFSKANLTKIGYRMRTDYVEILDVIKKLKKGGYTLEAVLDDALTYYFENSADGREAIRKAEIFYS